MASTTPGTKTPTVSEAGGRVLEKISSITYQCENDLDTLRQGLLNGNSQASEFLMRIVEAFSDRATINLTFAAARTLGSVPQGDPISEKIA